MYDIDTIIYHKFLYNVFHKDEYVKGAKEYALLLNHINSLNQSTRARILQNEMFLNTTTLETPKIMLLILTDSCQLKCKHCYFRDNPRVNELSFEQYKLLHDKMYQLYNYYAKLGFKKIIPTTMLMGGELTLAKDLIQIIKYTYENDRKVKFNSNALEINYDVCDIINSHKDVKTEYQISLEGIKEEHDFIRGQGTFDITIKNLRKLRSLVPDAKIIVSMNVHNENYEHIYDLAKLVKSLGANKLKVNRFVPTNDILTPITTENYKKVVDIALKAKKELDDSKFYVYVDKLDFPNHGYSCMVGSKVQVCNTNGDRLLCPRLHIKSGNWYSDSIEELAIKSLYWQIKLQTPPLHCLSCNKVKQCKGGAKCVTYYKKNNFDYDVNCIC